MTNARRPDETFEQYRERRKKERLVLKVYSNQVVWDSKKQGTYCKAKHGEIVVNR